MLRPAICLVVSVTFALTLAAAGTAAASDSRLESVSLRFGGGHSERSDVQIMPFMVHAGLRFPDLVDEPLRRVNLHLQWIVEGWVAPLFGPETTFEIGVNPIAFRLAWDRGQPIVPFASAGIGLLYTGLRDIGLGEGFQFDETVGFGVEYFVEENLSLSLAYRYRHMSNAGIYDDNAGLDTHYALIGLSWYPKRVAAERW
ncbi:MAG: acyloxyacyl hydrolase [Deltaproteobacteria bacterium]